MQQRRRRQKKQPKITIPVLIKFEPEQLGYIDQLKTLHARGNRHEMIRILISLGLSFFADGVTCAEQKTQEIETLLAKNVGVAA
jgi:hypothetical protein